MACNQNTVITTQELLNLKANTEVINEVVTSDQDATSNKDSDGNFKLTLSGALKKLGFQPPVIYGASISFASSSDNTKTIDRNGVIYAPFPSSIPFTTSGNWGTPGSGDDQDKFYVIQIDSSEAQTQIIGTPYSIFPSGITAYAQDGDTIPASTTHIRVLISGQIRLVSISPSASGTITSITSAGANIGGTDVLFFGAIKSSEIHEICFTFPPKLAIEIPTFTSVPPK